MTCPHITLLDFDIECGKLRMWQGLRTTQYISGQNIPCDFQPLIKYLTFKIYVYVYNFKTQLNGCLPVALYSYLLKRFFFKIYMCLTQILNTRVHTQTQTGTEACAQAHCFAL